MKKRTFKRLAAALLTGSMMVGMMGMTVCAEEPVVNDTAVITKYLTKDSNAYAPNTNYVFTIAAVADSDTDGIVDQYTNGNVSMPIYAGVEGGVKFQSDADNGIVASNDGKTVTITATPNATDIGEETLEYSATLKVLFTSFNNKPGIYRYLVTETKGSYDGITYDEFKHNLDVFIQCNEADGSYYVAAAVLTKQDGTDNKGTFNNSYATKDLTFTKTVSGNQGNKEADFVFPIEINGQAGEWYKVDVTIDGATTTNYLQADTNGKVEASYTLSDGDSVKIYGLSAADTYKISENDYSADGYTTSYKLNDGEAVTANTTGTSTMGETDNTVAYENNKQMDTPTGIITTFAPYILMVAFAAVVAFFFLRRRSREF